MTERIDLEPVAQALLTIVAGVGDDDLERPTPYGDHTVAEVLGHLVTLTRVLRDAAEKEHTALTDAKLHGAQWQNAAGDWRAALEEQIPVLVKAWSEDSAWEGTTYVGGLSLSARSAGQIALDELILHGWDIAKATGQKYPVEVIDARAYLEARALLEDVEEVTPVEVSDEADIFDRMVALTGRDPRWSPS